MKLKFLGGAKEVGCVCLYVQYNNKTFLVDYGFTPSKPPHYPLPIPNIDFVLLTHAHIDHSGMLPIAVHKYNTPIYSTQITRDIFDVLATDTIKISHKEGYPMLYTKPDLKKTLKKFFVIEKNSDMNIMDMYFKTYFSGHIPGSIMFEICDKEVLFTGDLNTIPTRLVEPAKPQPCKTLFLEGTYSEKDHEDRVSVETKFINKINATIENGGIALIPAFAVARTQEILLVIKDCDYDIWLDGMSISINEIFLNYPDEIRAYKELKEIIEKVNIVDSENARKKALNGEVIITTSGMLDGGPVQEYLQALRNKQNNSILLTGYQIVNTNGRKLLNTKKVSLYGVDVDVKCYIEQFDFSAHAGKSQLIDFVEACKPEKIVMYHCDKPKVLVETLHDRGYETITLENNQIYEL